MNSISWFLYAAGVVDNFGGVMVDMGVFCLLVCGVCWFGYSIADNDDTTAMLKRTGSWTPIAAAVILTVSCFVPSKSTMYAIAASQVGERVAQSEEVKGIANDATKALQQWIKRQIEPEAKK